MSDRIASLTTLLAAGMQIESCVDYNPSSGALPICGLTDPALTVTVNYRGDDGSAGSFTLRVGYAYGDGYFALYNDVPAIFKLSAETVQALQAVLALAA